MHLLEGGLAGQDNFFYQHMIQLSQFLEDFANMENNNNNTIFHKDLGKSDRQLCKSKKISPSRFYMNLTVPDCKAPGNRCDY